jgi:hypothetical protein
MKLENQVVSLELAKKLKELGVKQESYFWWYPEHQQLLSDNTLSTVPTMLVDRNYRRGTSPNGDFVSAFTVAELGEMLPPHFPTLLSDFGLYDCYANSNLISLTKSVSAVNEADARAGMLIYLIGNNLLTPTNNTKED